MQNVLLIMAESSVIQTQQRHKKPETAAKAWLVFGLLNPPSLSTYTTFFRENLSTKIGWELKPACTNNTVGTADERSQANESIPPHTKCWFDPYSINYSIPVLLAPIHDGLMPTVTTPAAVRWSMSKNKRPTTTFHHSFFPFFLNKFLVIRCIWHQLSRIVSYTPTGLNIQPFPVRVGGVAHLIFIRWRINLLTKRVSLYSYMVG